jgi:sodium/hydrogen exchanger 8
MFPFLENTPYGEGQSPARDLYYNDTTTPSNSTMPMSEGSKAPTMAPTPLIGDEVEVHERDAHVALLLNVTLIGCVMMAYFIKVHKLYYLPESAASILVGVVIGGIARISVNQDDLDLFQFSPELFFFVLLPPIIFEAGYSLHRKNFFQNLGAITLYAMFGTMASTFVVGYGFFYLAKYEIITGIDTNNPMEALLFGALISAVDPVATLSIMGSPELQCDELLYSLVFGESVLNDAIAIVLFKTFYFYYNPDNPDLESGDIFAALVQFVLVSLLSIVVGVVLGLMVSFIYKHTYIRRYPNLEIALLFLFCYCCYATAEAVGLSGIMALFFHGIILAHYNSYNLSSVAHTTSEQIFAALATVSETMVFLYMGMGVFTGKFAHWNPVVTMWGLLMCVLGRALNIFTLSFVANLCRRTRNKINWNMQLVLWFAGLRGAIAFALSENMPGPNKEVYMTTTLSICIFTTVVCGGFTERILDRMGMKQPDEILEKVAEEPEIRSHGEELMIYDNLIDSSPMIRDIDLSVRSSLHVYWTRLDYNYLKPMFGGSPPIDIPRNESNKDLEMTEEVANDIHFSEFENERNNQLLSDSGDDRIDPIRS